MHIQCDIRIYIYPYNLPIHVYNIKRLSLSTYIRTTYLYIYIKYIGKERVSSNHPEGKFIPFFFFILGVYYV